MQFFFWTAYFLKIWYRTKLYYLFLVQYTWIEWSLCLTLIFFTLFDFVRFCLVLFDFVWLWFCFILVTAQISKSPGRTCQNQRSSTLCAGNPSTWCSLGMPWTISWTRQWRSQQRKPWSSQYFVVSCQKYNFLYTCFCFLLWVYIFSHMTLAFCYKFISLSSSHFFFSH